MAGNPLLDTKQFCFRKYFEIEVLYEFEPVLSLSFLASLKAKEEANVTWHAHHQQFPVRDHLHLAYFDADGVASAFTILLDMEH